MNAAARSVGANKVRSPVVAAHMTSANGPTGDRDHEPTTRRSPDANPAPAMSPSSSYRPTSAPAAPTGPAPVPAPAEVGDDVVGLGGVVGGAVGGQEPEAQVGPVGQRERRPPPPPAPRGEDEHLTQARPPQPGPGKDGGHHGHPPPGGREGQLGGWLSG